MRDYYEILGVSPKAALSEIKKAYRELASKYHPDKHRGNDLEELAKEKLIEINAAYEVLSDENRRADYDRERQIRPRVAPSAQRSPSPSDRSSDVMQSVVRLAVVLLAVFFVLRFVRSFRAILIIGAVILAAWFLPRLFKKYHR
jgi:curved DNA-binding protein CbpA